MEDASEVSRVVFIVLNAVDKTGSDIHIKDCTPNTNSKFSVCV